MSQNNKSLSFLLDSFIDNANEFTHIEITNLTNDSREVTKNTLFLAFPGEKSDGRNYISPAIKNGAAAICYEPSDDFFLPDAEIPCIAIKNLKIKQSAIAARFYDFQSRKMPVIGVTGTNGKTSITHFMAQAMPSCAIIGTIGYGFLGRLKKTANTTPDGLQLQKIISELESAGAKTIAMEVSSHGLSEERVQDVQFHTAVFTNLTQDHLDFHGTMENYRHAKELLFLQKGLKNAVINIDDAAGKYFAEKYKDALNVMTYSLQEKNADIFVQKWWPTPNGFHVTVKTSFGVSELHCPLIGIFNIYNVLAVWGVLIFLELPLSDILKKLSQLKTADGRMQLIQLPNMPHIVIDYAHTPDALEKVLQHMRAHADGKLWCIFGCGGNRDKTKRSKMGVIAEDLSDYVVLTNDNPRDESPEDIVADILSSVKNNNKFSIELDRASAIAKTIKRAEKNDWILIAGKGHETEQIIGDKVLMHNDVDCVKKIAQMCSSNKAV